MLDFLSLPREIRDEIYKLCLVREKVEFEEFYTDETPEEWMKGRRPGNLMLHIAKPDEQPLLVYQGVPFVHRVESLTPIDGRSRWDDVYIKGRTRSYRICRQTTNPPYLGIFLTNRLVYGECSMIFYGKNSFCFPSKDCESTLNALSAFLLDRPKQALAYIKNLSLRLGTTKYLNGSVSGRLWYLFWPAHRPTLKRLGDILRRLITLDQLIFILEEQCPTTRALESLSNDQDNVGFVDWMDLLRDIRRPKTLEIETITSVGDDEWHKSRLSLLSSYMLSDWGTKRQEFRFLISSVHVRGKEIKGTRIIVNPQNVSKDNDFN